MAIQGTFSCRKNFDLQVKTLPLSKLVYTCTVKTPSQNVVEQLNSVHKNLIWNNKKPTVKHSTLITDYKEGRYKNVNIKSKILSLKVSWISELLDTNFHPWDIIPNQIFSEVGGAKIISHFSFKGKKRLAEKKEREKRKKNEPSLTSMRQMVLAISNFKVKFLFLTDFEMQYLENHLAH